MPETWLKHKLSYETAVRKGNNFPPCVVFVKLQIVSRLTGKTIERFLIIYCTKLFLQELSIIIIYLFFSFIFFSEAVQLYRVNEKFKIA